MMTMQHCSSCCYYCCCHSLL